MTRTETRYVRHRELAAYIAAGWTVYGAHPALDDCWIVGEGSVMPAGPLTLSPQRPPEPADDNWQQIGDVADRVLKRIPRDDAR